MLEAYGDIWDNIDDYDAVVITTNGFVKKNGEAVMGRGIAKEAATRYPLFPGDLGKTIKQYGNRVFGFCYVYNLWFFTLPVKPEYGPKGEMGWKAKAEIPLIERSVQELVGAGPYDGIINNLKNSGHKINKVLMPRPGCGNGGLKWKDVKPIIEPYLDDTFTVMTNEEPELSRVTRKESNENNIRIKENASINS